MIKAIETEYAGCRFRSRLEARWAVFFDHLQIEWEYEPQGYESESGRYLPDFWLPELHTWVEVKGQFTRVDIRKTYGALWDLGDPASGRPSRWLLILGPVPRPGTAWLHMRFDRIGDVALWQRAFFGEYGGQRWAVPMGVPLPLPRHYLDGVGDEWLDEYCRQWVEAVADPRLLVDSEVDDAYRAARSARFEYGESG